MENWSARPASLRANYELRPARVRTPHGSEVSTDCRRREVVRSTTQDQDRVENDLNIHQVEGAVQVQVVNRRDYPRCGLLQRWFPDLPEVGHAGLLRLVFGLGTRYSHILKHNQLVREYFRISCRLLKSKDLVGPPRFELGTSCTPSKRASQAAPRPDQHLLYSP